MPGKDVRQLIKAAIAYADVAEAHRAHEWKVTRTLQEAARLSMSGYPEGARKLRALAFMAHPVVFNYEDVHAGLIAAVKPFRKKKGG